MIEVTLWKHEGGTWDDPIFSHINVNIWTRRDGALSRISIESVKMAGGLAVAFADVPLTGNADADELTLHAAAITAAEELESAGGPFAQWRRAIP